MLRFFKPLFVFAICLFTAAPSFALDVGAASEMVSRYRVSRGLGRVKLDAGLNAMARLQANAMAAKDILSHDAAGSFRSRMAKYSVDAMRAAENIAYGSTTFEGSLRQWQRSPGHNVNLLMPSATRFGVAAAISRSGRIYWAMVVASDPPPRELAGPYALPQTRRAIRTQEGASMIMPFNLFGGSE